MKKILPIIAGILLGALFVFAGMMVLLNMAPSPKFPEGSPVAMFMGAFGPTGYMKFVKVFEVLGGILVAIPRTRNWGLLVLGPIILNILAFHIFIMNGKTLVDPMVITAVVLSLYLLWVGRHQFAGLLNRPATTSPPQV